MKKTSTKWMGTSQITTESLATESSILCSNLEWQQRFINEHVRKKYSKSQPKAGKYLMKKGSTMTALKAISKYVLALGNMHKDKAAAKPPKTNQHEENFYKVDGCKSNHYRKHCSRIMHSVRKLVLRTVVDQ